MHMLRLIRSPGASQGGLQARSPPRMISFRILPCLCSWGRSSLTSWAKALSRRTWGRPQYRHVHDMIPTAIGMFYIAFGRAPLDGEGALPVHRRKPAHGDAPRPQGHFLKGSGGQCNEVIRGSFGGHSREFGYFGGNSGVWT